ncbi:MAG TPA: hypothetical protein VMY76_06985 [Gemmatimonadales bacterium]|nr:hypothetical protein [Gemmatimonadales bacterium]
MLSLIRTISRRSLPFVAMLALATAACGGDDGSTGPSPSPSTGDATVTVVNHAPTGSVLFLRYRACGASAWGTDVLGSSVLSGGEQISWQLAAGCYDVRATPAEVGLDYLYFNSVQLDAGETETLEITAFPAEPAS